MRVSSTMVAGALCLLTVAGCAAPSTTTSASTPSAGDSISTQTSIDSSPAVSPTEAVPSGAGTVFIGDSVMSGFGLDDGDDWPTVLGARRGAQVTNLACAGAGFTVPGECGTDFAGLVAAAVDADPDTIVIQSSSNDLDASNEELSADTDATVAALRAALPHAHLIGLSTLWNDDPDIPDGIASSSRALKEAITTWGGVFIDVGQPLLGRAEWLQPDEIHPTVAGQVAIAWAVSDAAERAGVTLTDEPVPADAAGSPAATHG